MQKSGVMKTFRLSADEKNKLADDAKKCGITESQLLRNLVAGFLPKEKPDEEFFFCLTDLMKVAMSLNRIANRVESGDDFSREELGGLAREVYRMMILLREYFLCPEKAK